MNEIKQRIEEFNQKNFAELNGRQIVGVSKIIDFITEPFDKEGQAAACAARGAQDPKSKYAGMSAKDILDMWEQKAEVSRHYGTLLDSYAECVFENNPSKTELWKLDNNFEYDERLKGICRGFDEFYQLITGRGFIFIAREVPVYHESTINGRTNIVTGRLDALFYNPQFNKYLIVDWKTTDDIKTQAFRAKKMKGPAFRYEDCDMVKYSIQLFIYKHSLIDTYHISQPSDITACVVNLRREPVESNGGYHLIYKPCIEYEPQVLDDIVDFAIKKRELLKSI